MPARDRVGTAARHLASAAIVGLCWTAAASAQTVEIVPVGGYRFGGDIFERTTGRPVDLDGAPAIGGTVNIALGEGLWFDALYTRQQARVALDGYGLAPPVTWNIHVDQFQAGGCQDYGIGRVRPFLTGVLGLTRYAGAGESEIRFSVGAGGGVKIMLAPGLGVRLDSRVLTTFADVDAEAVACTPGTCVLALQVDALWQLEFSAGLIVRF